MRIEIGKKYKIVATDPLFSDWRGVIAECKEEVNGLYEMHANGAFIYSEGRNLRNPYASRKPKMSNTELTGAPHHGAERNHDGK